MENKILERFKMQKLKGFTLAEIIITMGIVGVIAALTVPDLLSDYQNKAMAVKIRKSVNDFESALDQYITAEGKQRFSQTTVITSKNLDSFVKENFRVIKTCDGTNACKRDCATGDEACAKEVETCKEQVAAAGCFASENYMSIDGEKSEKFQCPEKSYILADSSAICISPAYMGTKYVITNIWIDINGPAEPNIGGRDMFGFYYGNIIAKKDTVSGGDAPKCKTDNTGIGCIAKLQQNNWKMDY